MYWKIEFFNNDSTNIVTEKYKTDSDNSEVIARDFPFKRALRIVGMHNEALDKIKKERNDYEKWSHQFEDENEDLRDRLKKTIAIAKDMLDELKPYSIGRRDQSFPDWQKVWKEIKITGEFDYKFYPNHVGKDVIEEFENKIKEVEKP